MTDTVSIDTEYDTAVAEAVEWMVVVAVGDVTENEARAFQEWRAERPLNAKIYSELAQGQRALREALTTYREKKVSRRAVLSGGGTMVAAFGLFGLIRPPLGLWPSLADLMADHRTEVGERYTFEPTRGVHVELNSRTSVDLLDRGAGIRLIDGETFVTVQHPNGFRIEALGANVAASDAALNVETLGDMLRISCLTGRVRCSKGTVDALIGSGDQLSLASDGGVYRKRLDQSAIASWRSGKLVFEDAPLKDVIAQLNRYRSGAIVLTDSAKQYQPVSAVFFTDQIDGALNQLQRILNLNSRSLPGGVVVIS